MNIYSDQKYVVYHTTYSGDKFPANYIGSTTIDKIQQGYKGSVSSKEFKSIWKQELNTNPHLFSVQIISYHDTRPAATYKELQIQKLFNVVTNPLFINKSYAQPNGFFGMNISGKNHPNYGKTGKNSPNFGKKHSKERREKNSKSKIGITHTEKRKRNISLSKLGKKQPNVSKARKGNKYPNASIAKNNNTYAQKEYYVVDPTGNKINIINLKKFCKEYNLNYSCMANVSNNRATHHKQWKCVKV